MADTLTRPPVTTPPLEGVRVLAPGEHPDAARLAAARAWVATADQVARRRGPAAHAQLTAYPALAAWYGHRAAELALPSPW